MDIAKILRSLPKNTKLFSPAFGEVVLTDVNSDGMITVWVCGLGRHEFFFSDGHFMNTGDCMLFPSSDNRDWNSFKSPKFDPSTLKPFDKVLTRRQNATTWMANLFSHLALRNDKHVCITQHYYVQCVPFNDDTKHLLGTADPAPDFYNTWD